jgi:hypothetical protein
MSLFNIVHVIFTAFLFCAWLKQKEINRSYLGCIKYLTESLEMVTISMIKLNELCELKKESNNETERHTSEDFWKE